MKVKSYPLRKLESNIDCLYLNGEYEKTIDEAKEILHFAKAKEDMRLSMNSYLKLACCKYYLGKIEIAFNYVLQYKLLCDEFGDDRDQYYLYFLSALIFGYEENYEEAKEALEQCIQLARKLEMFYEEIVSYNIYSHYLLHEENYYDAYEYATKARELAEIHCPYQILLQYEINLNIAASYIGLGELLKAKSILNSHGMHRFVQQNKREKSHFLFLKAMLHRELKEYDVALKYLKECYEIYSLYNNQRMLKSVTKIIAEIREEVGDYKGSCHAFKEYVKVSENLSTTHLSSKIKDFNIQQSIKAIERRANIDCLTGVYNRYYLEVTCSNWLKEAKQTAEHVCCIAIDIDSFKKINDSFGHLIGDEVIKGVGQACLAITDSDREHMLSARYGGDEFVVLLKGFNNHEIMEKAKELFQEISSIQLTSLSNEIKVTVSMGIACSDSLPTARNFHQLFKIADEALYMAKNQGKNQIVFLSNEHCKVL